MPGAIPEPEIYFGGSDIDKLEVPEYDTQWSDYGNALQIGGANIAEAVNRVPEYALRQAGSDKYADKFADNARFWSEVAQEQRGQYSPGARQSLAKPFATTDPEEAAWADLSSVMLHATESAPATAATLTPIGAAVRLGITSKAALAGIGALTEGTLGAGFVAGDIAGEIESLSSEQLGKVPGVPDLRELGWSDKKIKGELIAQQQALTVPAGGAATAAIGAVAGPIEAKIFSPNAGLLRRTGRGVATEAVQEALQEPSETAAANVGLGKPATEGTLEASLAGAFSAGPAGGGFAALTGGKTRKQKKIEEGYREIYNSGTPEQVDFYRQGLITIMGQDEAQKFMQGVEEEVDASKERDKRSFVSPEEEEALKAHEAKPEKTPKPATAAKPKRTKGILTPDDVDVDAALRQAAEDEEAAEAEQFRADDEAAEAEEFGLPRKEDRAFTGTGLEHFDNALNTTIEDASKDATVGKPITLKSGKQSPRKTRYPKERAYAVADIVDDVVQSLQTLKEDGYNTEPLERVIGAFAKNRADTLPSDSIRAQFKHRSGGGFYQSPYKPTKKALGGDRAIDQFLKDLRTARDEMEQAGTQEVFTDQAPAPEPRVSIVAQINAVERGDKRGVLVTPKTRVKSGDIPDGFKRTRLPNNKGSFIYPEEDKEAVKTAKAWAKDEAAHPEFPASILNYGTGRKANTPVVTTARDDAGTVVQDVVGTGGEIEQAAAEVAGEGGTVETRTAEEALAERESTRAAEEPAPKKETEEPAEKKGASKKRVSKKRSSKKTPTKSAAPKKKQAEKKEFLIDGTVFHAVRNNEDIPSILKGGLKKGTNLGQGAFSQSFTGEGDVVLIYDENDVAMDKKAYRDGEGVVSRQKPAKPKAVGVNVDELVDDEAIVDADTMESTLKDFWSEWGETITEKTGDDQSTFIGRLTDDFTNIDRFDNTSLNVSELQSYFGGKTEGFKATRNLWKQVDQFMNDQVSGRTEAKTAKQKIEDAIKNIPASIPVFTFETTEDGQITNIQEYRSATTKEKPAKQSKAKATSEARGSVSAKSAAENVWKLAQGSVTVDIAKMRENTGVTDKSITPERIRELLNTAIEEIKSGKDLTDGLSNKEKDAVKKLNAFVRDVASRGSIKKQVEALDKETRPPELKTKSGKGLTGLTGQAVKLKLVSGSAQEMASSIVGQLENVDDARELVRITANAISDVDAEPKFIEYMEELGVDPATLNTLLEGVQAGRMTISGGKDVAFDRNIVVSDVVAEADGLNTDGVNTLIDALLDPAFTTETRNIAITSLAKALRTQYGVSEETTNNFVRVVNEVVGTTDLVKRESAHERGYTDEDFIEDLAEDEVPVYTFDSIMDEIKSSSGARTPVSAEIIRKRAQAGRVLSVITDAVTRNNSSIPLPLAIDSVLGFMDKQDPMYMLLDKVRTLHYSSAVLRSEKLENDRTHGRIKVTASKNKFNVNVLLNTTTIKSLLEKKNKNSISEVAAGMTVMHAFAHELVHMSTFASLSVNKNLRARIDALIEEVKANTNQNWYGLTDADEFVAEAFTNPDFQEELNRIRSSTNTTQTIWDKFLNAVAKLLGFDRANKGSILDEVVTLTPHLFKTGKESADIGVSIARSDIRKAMEGVDLNKNPHPADDKLVASLYSKADDFTAGASNVLIKAMGNDGSGKYDTAMNHLKQAGSSVRRFMLGNMMLDQIETAYDKIFSGLMDNRAPLIMTSTYKNVGNPLHVLIRALQNRQAAAKKFEARHNDLLERIKRMETNERTKEAVYAMYDVAHDATMAQVHPDEVWDSEDNKGFYTAVSSKNRRLRTKNQEAEAKLIHERLRKQYIGLPAPVKQLYKDMRDFYTQTQAIGRGKLRANIIRKYGFDNLAQLDIAGQIMEDMTNEQIDEMDLGDIDEADKTSVRKALKSLNNQALSNGPYFPLLRYGDYVAEARKDTEYTFDRSRYASKAAMRRAIDAMKIRLKAGSQGSGFDERVDKNGNAIVTHKEYAFVTAETKDRIEKKRAELVKEGFNVEQAGLKNETDFKHIEGAAQLMAIAERKLKGNDADKERARVAIREALVSFMPESAMQKRLMKRENKAGASKDMGRSLANYMKSAAWSLANLDYITDITEATHSLNRASQNARERGGYTDTQIEDMTHVAGEISRRMNNPNEPGLITEYASKLGFFNYLFSLSYSVVNSSQPALVTLPYLSGKYGTRKATAALGDAYRMVGGKIAKEAMATGFGWSAFTERGVDANQIVTDIRELIRTGEGGKDIDALLQQLQDEDIIGATFTLEIAEAAKGRGRKGKVSDIFHRTLEMGRTLPHIVEIMNRTTTAIATYKLARQKGTTHDSAVEEARLAVRKTQFDYSELNRPFNFVRNDLLRAMTMFKIHPLGIYGLLVGNVKTLLSNESTKEEGKAAFKTVSMLLAMHGSVAGLAGSVLLEPVKVAMGMLSWLLDLGLDDDDAEELRDWLRNPEVAMRQFIYEATGSPGVSEAVVFGAPRAVGIDMHTRLGLQSLMFMGSNKGDTRFERAMNTVSDSLLGPIIGMQGGFVRGAAAIANGQGWARGSEYFMPKAVRDMQRAYRYGTIGMTDFNGNLIQNSDKFGAKDLAVRVLGFSPSVEAETQFGRGYKQRRTGRLRRKVNGLVNRWKNADKNERNELWRGEIRDFNQSLTPEERRAFRITMSKLRKSLLARRRRERETVKGTHFTKRERALEKDLDFINLR